jgi:serine/threonine protein kinase
LRYAFPQVGVRVDEARVPEETADAIEPSEPASRDGAPPRVPSARSAGPQDAAFAPGSLIADKYVVERVIGEGGLGVVVAARHLQLEQTVAIKYLRTAAVKSPRVVERFLREARIAGKIRSEHVTRVYDVGMLAESPYIVMEYLDGTDLGRVLEAGPLPVERAVDYILQACEALAEAHAAGIVHRDLKPENLFLAKKAANASVIKILDFGISKLLERTGDDSPRRAELTKETDKFGTPSYMSPEQLRSAADVDARADIWATGVVLYELLTGRRPFQGDGLAELVTAILHLPPTPLTLAGSNVPAGLDHVISRCLATDRTARFPTVAELAQELRPFAPNAAHARIDHIVSVVREAGKGVGPPTADSPRFSLPDAAAMTTSASARPAIRGFVSRWLHARRLRPAVAAFGLAILAGVATLTTARVRRAPEPSAGGLAPNASSFPASSASSLPARPDGLPILVAQPSAASSASSQGAAPARVPLPRPPREARPPFAAPTVPSARRDARPSSSAAPMVSAKPVGPAVKPVDPAPKPLDPEGVVNPFE